MKKLKYFSSKNGVAMYATTTQVLTETKWTPEVLEQRQQDVLSRLSKVWQLEYGTTA